MKLKPHIERHNPILLDGVEDTISAWLEMIP